MSFTLRKESERDFYLPASGEDHGEAVVLPSLGFQMNESGSRREGESEYASYQSHHWR